MIYLRNRREGKEWKERYKGYRVTEGVRNKRKKIERDKNKWR